MVDGTGWIDCAHGRFPIPAPATLAVLGARGIPLSQCEEPHELVTPTGAALLAELVERFGPMQNLTAEKIGFGLGTRDHVSRPNALRAILGEAPAAAALAPGGSAAAATAGSNSVHDWQTDAIAVLETNLDDIHAELLGRFVETALAAGALDVFHTPIQMKKSRPGVRLSVLCALADADKLTELILLETSAFGVRRYTAERRKLAREWLTVSTPHGQVQVKLGRLDGRVVQAAPEFESCQRVAEQAKVPLKQVYDAALRSLPPSLCAGPIHAAANAGAGTASSLLPPSPANQPRGRSRPRPFPMQSNMDHPTPGLAGLLKLLRCPETRQELRLAEPALIDRLNRQITAGALHNRAGRRLADALEAGLVRADGKFLYPIRRGVPVMLTDEAVPLEATDAG